LERFKYRPLEILQIPLTPKSSPHNLFFGKGITGASVGKTIRPYSLRAYTPAANILSTAFDSQSTRKVTVGCLIAVASISGAEAQQQQPLPPVTVNPPVVRKKPPAAKPTAEQIRARNALRRATRAKQEAANPASTAPATPAGPPDGDPYANPAAPYMANTLASSKFTQPIVNQPKSITVITREVIDDKQATSLKDIARTTAGVTLGTGEGGNAFGDRFFIRGFDARNDIFVDGIRDPGVSIRENFFTEQIEILKGPSATINGRGTTGGALNIVTKQATTAGSFYNADTTIASDDTRRVTLDVNQVINKTLAVRLDGMWQNAGVAERNYTTDDRGGALAGVTWTPNDSFKVEANYIHTSLWGTPDFGVPYNVQALQPVTSVGIPRPTYYGFVNRDFQKVQQDFGTVIAEAKVNDFITVYNETRDQKSVLNYIGTIPESPNTTSLNPANWTTTLNPSSRYQTTTVLANQTYAVTEFNTGPIKNSLVTGFEASHEQVSIDTYTGLSSEALGAGAFNGSGSVAGVSMLNPPNLIPFTTVPSVTGNPNVIPVDTKSVYALETADYRDFIILTAGGRFDRYDISASKIGFPTVWTTSGMWNYNLGAVVKPVPIASVYWAYGTGSEPVGSELDGTSANYGGLNPSSPITQIFSPIESTAQEVGTKWELFDKRLLATGALFRTDVSNARELVPAGFPNAGTVQAGAAYHVEGIDLGAQGKITDKWSIYTGLVLMRTRVDQSAVPSNIGLPLAFVANQSFNVLTKYQLTDTIEVGGQATYRSQIYGGTLLAANQGTVLPDYWRFDAFLEGKVTKNWKWKLYANNIFNKLYYDAFYQSAAPFTLVAPGRVLGVEVMARF
jgi:catecholate siderophore receptor